MLSAIKWDVRTRFGTCFLLTLGCALPACSSDSKSNNNADNAGSGGVAGTSGASAMGGSAGVSSGGNAGTGEEGGAAGSLGGEGGAGGDGGASGNGGAAGDSVGGQGGSDAGVVDVRSAGCDQDVNESPDDWNTHDIAVTVDAQFASQYSQRRYFTRPPANYDPHIAYPVTIWGQGCGQSVAENTPLTDGPAAANSIQVELLAKSGCYSAGPDGDNVNSPELPYFDAVLAQAEATYCIDKSKVFVGGYSSGGWVTGLISCARANVVRGVGVVAAGLQLNHQDCAGPVAALITRGMNDGGTPLAQTLALRDSILMRNGCSMDTLPWDQGEASFDSSSCLEYQNCMPGYPVVWCPTPGEHSNGRDTGLSTQGFWKLWASLP